MNKLAINGDEPIRKRPFPSQETTGIEEQKAIQRVMESKTLSAFRGNWSRYFYGGPEVQKFEEEFADKFNVKHAIAVNSCTSALIISCGAVGIEPGDEVIVTPWSMTCSATAPMIYGGIPVFADIERDYFCLDPIDVEKKITPKTKAIIAVSLFGQPFSEQLNKVAEDNEIPIIEDAAQAIGSTWTGGQGIIKHAGTLGDLGCFSFTQGKHLTAGEGGMIVTDNDWLAQKCRLIRNHAESVLNDMPECISIPSDYNINMVGFNMRMTEIQAAILREQLKKLDRFIEVRQQNAEDLYTEICDAIPAIKSIPVRDSCTHSYYVQGFYWQDRVEGWESDGIHRNTFIKAVVAELMGEEGRADRPMIGGGYITPLYRMPLFKYNQHWAIEGHDYNNINLPVVEKLYNHDFFLSLYHSLPLEFRDKANIRDAFIKVWENQEELKNEN